MAYTTKQTSLLWSQWIALALLAATHVQGHGGGTSTNQPGTASLGAELPYYNDTWTAYDNRTIFCFYGLGRAVIPQEMATGRVFFYLQASISFPGPCGNTLPPSPPPRAPHSKNATAQPAPTILLDLSFPSLKAATRISLSTYLWVTGYPLQGQGVRTKMLYVVGIKPGAIASGGGPDAVVPTLKRPDPWGPPLRLKVGAALVSFATSIGELYPQRLDADGVMQAFSSGGGQNTVANFLSVCSYGEVLLEDIGERGEGLSVPVSLYSVDLLDVLGVAHQLQDASLRLSMCLSNMMMALREQVEGELGRMGQDYVGEVDRRRWAYMFIALPDNLYSFALIQCGQMDDPNGGALGTSKLLMDTIFNCRNEESCVTTMLQANADTQLSQAAVRGLGRNFGLREFGPRRADGMSHPFQEDPTSGLTASSMCFNGPQSWLLGWMEVPEEYDIFISMEDEQAAFGVVERRVLLAHGMSKESIMRVRAFLTQGDNREAPLDLYPKYNSVFWVMYRTTSESVDPYFRSSAFKPQLALYQMDQRRDTVCSERCREPHLVGRHLRRDYGPTSCLRPPYQR